MDDHLFRPGAEVGHPSATGRHAQRDASLWGRVRRGENASDRWGADSTGVDPDVSSGLSHAGDARDIYTTGFDAGAHDDDAGDDESWLAALRYWRSQAWMWLRRHAQGPALDALKVLLIFVLGVLVLGAGWGIWHLWKGVPAQLTQGSPTIGSVLGGNGAGGDDTRGQPTGAASMPTTVPASTTPSASATPSAPATPTHTASAPTAVPPAARALTGVVQIYATQNYSGALHLSGLDQDHQVVLTCDVQVALHAGQKTDVTCVVSLPAAARFTVVKAGRWSALNTNKSLPWAFFENITDLT